MSRQGKHWTEIEVQILKNNYMNLRYKDIADLLGRTEKSIRHKVCNLDLKRKGIQPIIPKNPWTELDIELLKRNYLNMKYKDLGAVLKRTEGSIRNKVYELGLDKKAAEPWSEYDIKKLKDYYKSHEIIDTKTLENMFTGRSKYNICRKAREYGLTNVHRKFSEQRKLNIGDSIKEWYAENPHPRGMLGHKHTKKTKSIISKKSKEMWSDPDCYLNSDEYRKMLSDRAIKTNLAGNRNRYSNGKMGKREDLDGLFVRSSWEANYARYLNWLVDVGEINKWEYESDVFWFHKIKRGTRSYTPDFKVFLKNGDIEYHEVKGWMDPKSKTKLKRMEKYYPNIKIVLIDKKAYYSLQRDVKNFIDNWE